MNNIISIDYRYKKLTIKGENAHLKNTKKYLLATTIMASALAFAACDSETVPSKEEGNTAKKEQEANHAHSKHKETGKEEHRESAEKHTQTKAVVLHKKEDSTHELKQVPVKKESPIPAFPGNHSNEKEQTLKEIKEKPDSSKATKAAVASILDVKEQKNYQAIFHNGWKSSPSAEQQATIDGRGEEAIEEGQGVLVIQNKKTNVSKLYSIKGELGTQITPKYVEWIDEDRVYVIVGFAYGTVSKGGNLYELNLTDNSVKPAIDNLKEHEEIVSIKQNTLGTFTYKKHIYDDDNVSVGHFEEGTLPISYTK